MMSQRALYITASKVGRYAPTKYCESDHAPKKVKNSILGAVGPHPGGNSTVEFVITGAVQESEA